MFKISDLQRTKRNLQLSLSLDIIRIYIIVILVLLSNFKIFATEYPPIIKYLPEIYNAGNQNWKISQDSMNIMYFANNDGLLEFNGSEWTLYPSPNETIIRSVKVVDNKIFTGCYKDFGY